MNFLTTPLQETLLFPISLSQRRGLPIKKLKGFRKMQGRKKDVRKENEA
jgi:hypothetical protein